MILRATTLAILFLVFASVVAAQEEYPWPTPEPTPVPRPECDHESNSVRRFQLVRMLPPFQITELKLPESIRYRFRDDVENVWHVGSLTVDEKSAMPANVWREYRERWYWVIYCERDGHVYTLTEVAPGQMKTAATAQKRRQK